MNHLAHFQLSQGDPGWLVGSLLGDFVKGPLQGDYPNSWEQGILLHRRIDAFTDQHPIWRSCVQQFEPKFRRYAGIMLDLAADHWLSKHWAEFHSQPLEQFCQDLYQLLDSTQGLPKNAQRVAARIIEHKGLQSYQDWEGVENALVRVSQRFKRRNPLAEAGTELQRHSDFIEHCFLQFYPQLEAYSREQRQAFLLIRRGLI